MSCKINRSFSIVSIHSAFEEERDINFSFAGEFHDFWEVVYVASGKIGVTEDDRVYELEKGDIIFHRPLEFHKVWSRGDKKPRVFTMSFKTEGDVPRTLGDGIIHLNAAESSTFLNIFSQAKYLLYKKEERDLILEQKFSSDLERFIIYLAHERTADTTFSKAADALRYNTIINVMQQHICEDLSVDDIAHYAHMAPSTMKNAFSKYSDCGVRKHFVRMKLAESVPLLKRGDSIAEISKLLSFSSQNYFSTVFKAEMGMSPAEYRKKST